MNGKKDFGKKFWEEIKGKKLKKDQLLIFLLAGVLLIIALPDGGKESSDGGDEYVQNITADGEQVSAEEYTRLLENRLEDILSRMEGAGEVSVMITLESSAEKIVEKDTERNKETVEEGDSQGGTRTTQNEEYREEAVYGGNGNEESRSPYISKELSPKIGGVVVIAPGGDNAVVVKNITEAVQALFGIDTHKIRIVKGRREA